MCYFTGESCVSGSSNTTPGHSTGTCTNCLWKTAVSVCMYHLITIASCALPVLYVLEELITHCIREISKVKVTLCLIVIYLVSVSVQKQKSICICPVSVTAQLQSNCMCPVSIRAQVKINCVCPVSIRAQLTINCLPCI